MQDSTVNVTRHVITLKRVLNLFCILTASAWVISLLRVIVPLYGLFHVNYPGSYITNDASSLLLYSGIIFSIALLVKALDQINIIETNNILKEEVKRKNNSNKKKYFFLLIGLIVTTPFSYAYVYQDDLLGISQTILNKNWLNGWGYRKSHLINSAPGAGTNYQVKIRVLNSAGVDAGDTVYVNGKTRNDFSDIRFTDQDEEELDYWLETKTDGVSAVFWVEVKGDLSTSPQTIHMYYGNGNAASTSNGGNTFIFFDDFSGDLSKWSKLINGANIYMESGYLVCGGGVTSSPYGHTVLGSSLTYNSFVNGVIEAKVYPSSNALPEIGFRGNYATNTGYKGRWDSRSGSESPWMKPPYNGWAAFGSSVARFGLPNQWQTVKLEVSGSTFKIYSNDVLKSTVSDVQYQASGEISLQNHYGSFSRFDDVRVRKFVNPEPSHGVWGIEETP